MNKTGVAMSHTQALLFVGTAVLLGCSSASPSAEVDSGAGTGDARPEAAPDPTKDAGAPSDGGARTDAHEAATECPYPAGPYGTGVGDVLDAKLVWQAYAPGATTPSTLHVTDLYDCDGKKGINALVIDTSGQWCVACQYEAESIPTWMTSMGADAGGWGALGVSFLTLIIQNDAYEPATIVTAKQWRAMFGLTSIYVAADPNASLPAKALPHNLLIDPRTMKIFKDLDNDPSEGSPAPDPAVAALATKNAK
jgi:hypothetical protein